MKRPANYRIAGLQARSLLVKRLPGSRRGTVRQHLARSQRIAELIWRRWHVGPGQWRLKHIRWYLLTRTAHLGSGTRYRHWLTVRTATQVGRGTRYRHWLTVRQLIVALDKDGWIERLDGPWVRPSGERGALKPGRPPNLPTPSSDWELGP